MNCSTTPKDEKKMEIPTFIYNIFPPKKREELINKRNVRVIKEFLRKREQIISSKENDIAHLERLRKDNSITKSTYRRLKQAVILTHDKKRIDLIKKSIDKSISIDKYSVSYDNQEFEDDTALVSIVESN
jgi:hypothetical protein